jgi:hypothetical protein
MLFDHTRITVRERNFPEILDLALQMVREHWRGLSLALVVGATPWALANYFLLRGLIDPNEIWNEPATYGVWMTILMALEAPLATAPLTLYLGQATFSESVSARKVVSDFFASLPQLLWLQGVLRALTGILLGIGLLIPYLSWPYLSEVILLERNPLFYRSGGPITTWRRNRNLHRHSGGDLFSRWLAAVAAGVVLGGSVVWGLHTTASHLAGAWPDELTILRWYVPLAGWLVLGFFAVVRFLSYLDLRIRREGWEVELTMRAEAIRLAGGIVG